MDLTQKKCVPCEGGIPPYDENKIKDYLTVLKTKWEVVDNKKLKKEFKFKDFKEAMTFVNKVADIAEEENHHPDISIYYSKVVIELWTHKIGGLHENDFIMASKIERLESTP